MTPEAIVGRMGENAVFKGSSLFMWGEDSVKRKNEVRYEWKFNDIVVSEEMDFEIPTAELKEKIGLEYFSDDVPTYGTFAVIDKASGVSYLAKVMLWIYSAYTPGDWIILTQNGDHAELSVLRGESVWENGNMETKYTLKENVYKEANNDDIPGKAVNLAWGRAKHIGSQGSWTVITDQVAYELNAEDLVKVDEIKDQFLDGTPTDFVVTDRRDKDPATYHEGASSFVATRDGRVFTRTLNENYMGGKFLTEPYYIDERGYKITKFGHNSYGATIPCYDEKNRRIVIASVWSQNIGENNEYHMVFRTNMVALTNDGWQSGPRVGGFTPGTEILYLGATQHCYGMTTMGEKTFTVYYNDPASPGGTLVGDFAYNENTQKYKGDSYLSYLRYFRVPLTLDESSVFLLSASFARSGISLIPAAYRDFFSSGNKLYYAQRGTSAVEYTTYVVTSFMNGMSFDSKITCLSYDSMDNCKKLFVGCEGGEIYVFDISVIQNPVLLYKTKMKGKVVCGKQLLGANAAVKYDYF